MNLADNLKKIRKENNLSQEQLAEKLGVSRQSVSKWESGVAYPEMDKVLQLCKIFNLNIDELLNQNIKEAKEKKEFKSNINKYMDDFLSFITKTVDMFSSMKLKDKIKCLFEQIFIGVTLFIVFLVLGLIGNLIVGNILDILPYDISSFILNVFEGLYILIAIISSIVIFLHVFKVRYLDYYIIIKKIKEENEIKEETSNNKEIELRKEKVYLEKKEKVIIRDPNHSGYRFIKGLLSCIIFIIKLCSICFAIFCILPLIFLVILFIISFVFIKTGITFIGILIAIISAIVINLIVLYILYNFIFSKKSKTNKIAFIFIISIITFSVGFGLTIVGIKDFNYINDINSKYYVESEKTFNMNDTLMFDEGYYSYYGYHYNNIEYIQRESDDIKVVCKHSENYICNIEIYNNKIYTHIYQNNTNLMQQLRDYINDINSKEIIDYSNYKIIVYTSKENIDKLIKNSFDYMEYLEENNYQEKLNSYQNEINSLYQELDKKNDKIYELCDRIYELDEESEEIECTIE